MPLKFGYSRQEISFFKNLQPAKGIDLKKKFSTDHVHILNVNDFKEFLLHNTEFDIKN